MLLYNLFGTAYYAKTNGLTLEADCAKIELLLFSYNERSFASEAKMNLGFSLAKHARFS